MEIVEIIGACIGLLYLFLEYKANVWLWPVGILMSIFYVVIYLNGKFYADAFLNMYYILANIYGLAVWSYKLRKKEQIKKREDFKISKTPSKKILPIILVAVILWIVIYLILYKFTDSPVPIGDSFTTSLSIIAMWMLSQKYLEQWILWIVVNVVSVGLYFWKGLHPTAVLYCIYTVVACLGFIKWRKLYNEDLMNTKVLS